MVDLISSRFSFCNTSFVISFVSQRTGPCRGREGIRRMIGQVDGVMLGRAAYQNPWLLVHADAINREVATATASMLRPKADSTGTSVLNSTAVQQEDVMPITRRRVVEEYLTTIDRIRVSL